MKTVRQARREAGTLWRLCLVDGKLDDARARVVADRLAESGHAGDIAVLKQFVKRLRVEEANRTATVASAMALDPLLQSQVARDLARLQGRPVAATFLVDPALIGGMRVKVGSDVYDGSVRGELAALQSQF